jgi:PKD repeat protein
MLLGMVGIGWMLTPFQLHAAGSHPPLPSECGGATPGALCCLYGYIYEAGAPVQGADVRIESARGTISVTSAVGGASPYPYYRADLTAAPLALSAGERLTLTAIYSGAVGVRTWQVLTGGQQVDVGLVASGAALSRGVSIPKLMGPDEPASPAALQAVLPTPAWVNESDNVNANYGYAVAGAGDVNGDGYDDFIVGAYHYDSTPGGGDPDDLEGKFYVYHGSATGLEMTAALSVESNVQDALLGASVGTAGDVNGDGYDDIIVGAPLYGTPTHYREGRVFVHYGSPTGLSATPNWIARSGRNQTHYPRFGRAVGTAGDVNGDGYDDVIIGAQTFSTNPGGDANQQLEEGWVFVYHGSATGLKACADGTCLPADADWTAEGVPKPQNPSNPDHVYEVCWFGAAVGTAGDVNGDGYDDVVIGAPKYETPQARNDELWDFNEGAAFVWYGSASGLGAHGTETNADWLVVGGQGGARLGNSVSTAGDVNQDGHTDVLVGARAYTNGETEEGRVHVYHGAAGGLSSSAAWTAEGDQAGANFGASVAAAGDVDGDGYGDVLVGASRYDNGQTNEGASYLYRGSATGLGPNGTPLNADWSAEGEQAEAEFGNAVAGAGDVNGDGAADVAVGAHHYDNGQTDEGRGGVYLSDQHPPTGSVTIDGGAGCTERPTVTLTLAAVDPFSGAGVTELHLCNAGDGCFVGGVGWTSWQPYTSTLIWRLPSAPGLHRVIVQFRDGMGYVSALYSDTIVLYGGACPLAQFTATPTVGVVPLTTQFVDGSQGDLVGWTWRFGDGAISGARHPSHGYHQGAIHPVTLTVTGPGGGYAVQVAEVTALPAPPRASLLVSPTVGLTSTHFLLDASASYDYEAARAQAFREGAKGLDVRWDWDADGVYDIPWTASPTVRHRFATLGRHTLRLAVRDADGLTDSVTATVEVKDLVARFSAAPRWGTSPLTVTLTNESVGHGQAGGYLWDFGDGVTSTVAHPTHTYTRTGTYTVALAVSAMGTTMDTATDTVHVYEDHSWTWMLYFAGDNDLAEDLERALDAMGAVALPDNVNVVVLYDGDAQDDTVLSHYDREAGAWVTHSDRPWDIPERNMGYTATLVSFVRWSRETYPAQYDLLAIADHGRGTTGIAWDDTSGKDPLASPWELGAALDAVTRSGSGRERIDVLYLDACLMAMAEVAHEVSPYAAYLVAYENLGWGLFAYDHYVQAITATTTPRRLADAIADRYDAGLAGHPRTVSALDLSAVGGVVSTTGLLATGLQAALPTHTEAISRAWEDAQKLDACDYLTLDSCETYLDLVHFAALLASDPTLPGEVRGAAQGVVDAVGAPGEGFLVEEHHHSGNYCPPSGRDCRFWDLADVHGLAIYFPPGPAEPGYEGYSGLSFAQATGWSEFLDAYLSNGGGAPHCPIPSAPLVPQMPSPAPSLAVSETMAVLAGDSLTVPIRFTDGGQALSGVNFGLEIDPSLMSFDDGDIDGDGVPDAIGWGAGILSGSVTLDGGTVNVTVTGTPSSLAALSGGTLVSITLVARDDVAPAIAPLTFSEAPPATFVNAVGWGISGVTLGGSVHIVPPEGAGHVYLPLILKASLP